MSQSDYITYKRRSVELKKQTSLPHVLSADQYIGFKQFAAENNIVSTSQTYNQLPNGTKVIFDIPYSHTGGCSTFIVDRGTQSRPNRVTTLPPNLNIIQPATYVKFPKVVCAKCTDNNTYATSKNTINTDFMLGRLNRLKNKLCQCTSIR